MANKLILSVLVSGVLAINAANVRADIIQSGFSKQTTNGSLEDIADHAVSVEERLALLGELVKGYANGTYSAADVTDRINSSKILQDGDSFQLFKRRANQENADVSSEQFTLVGAGSRLGTNRWGTTDIANVASITLDGKTYNFAGSTTAGAVAIGSPTQTRTLTNLSAGRVTESSVDAVNGSQLYAVVRAAADAAEQANANKANIAKGFGVQDKSGKKTNIKSGDTLSVVGDGNITAAVTDKTVTLNLAKDLTGLNSAAFNGGVAIGGNGINAGKHKITNVADGSINAHSKDAVNGSQLFNYVKRVSGGGFTAVADDGSKLSVSSVGDLNIGGGRNIETKSENGKLIVQTKQNVEFDKAQAGNITINNNGRIINVDDGRIAENSRDVVNGGQIHALKQEIDKDNKVLKQGIAASFASQIEYPEQRPGDVAAGIGMGHYGGETAAAVGVSFLTESGKYKINATYSQGLARRAKPGGKVSFGMLF